MAEIGIPYTLTSPYGRAVFGGPGAEQDADYVGRLSSENGITGLLDMPDNRSSAGNRAGGDGGYEPPGFLAARTGTMQGWIDEQGGGMAVVNARQAKLEAAADATNVDAILTWSPSTIETFANIVATSTPGTISPNWTNNWWTSAPVSSGVVNDLGGGGLQVFEFSSNGVYQGLEQVVTLEAGRRYYVSMLVRSAEATQVLIGRVGGAVDGLAVPNLKREDSFGAWERRGIEFVPGVSGSWLLAVRSATASPQTVRFNAARVVPITAPHRMLRCRRTTGPSVTDRRPKKWQLGLRSGDARILDRDETTQAPAAVGTISPASGGTQAIPNSGLLPAPPRYRLAGEMQNPRLYIGGVERLRIVANMAPGSVIEVFPESGLVLSDGVLLPNAVDPAVIPDWDAMTVPPNSTQNVTWRAQTVGTTGVWSWGLRRRWR